MSSQAQELKSKKLQYFVNRYLEEFSSTILLRQMLSHILSAQKRRELVLESVLEQRIYTSEIDKFTPAEKQELEEYLKNKIRGLKRKNLLGYSRNILYTLIGGCAVGILCFFSKFHLLWILPLMVIYFIHSFKKSSQFTETIATYTILMNWLLAYQLRKNKQKMGQEN